MRLKKYSEGSGINALKTFKFSKTKRVCKQVFLRPNKLYSLKEVLIQRE